MSHHSEEPSYMNQKIRELVGPTGEFPLGKYTPDDRGEIRVAIAADPEQQKVIMNFGVPTAWIAFTPEQARQLAEANTSKAFECRGIQ